MSSGLAAPNPGDPLGTGGRYRVVRRLATGGMGEVLLCEFEGDAKVQPGLVVVKRTFPKHPNREHANNMMREEARVAVRLRHENLVETFGVEEFASGPLLSMEYLPGRSMAQVLGAAKTKKQPVPVDVCIEILRQCAFGLHFAHTLHDGDRFLGLVHRDVSPANVVVTFDGRIKVIDFGVAKADDSEIKTSTGILKGKLGYMAPEHASGDKLDCRADLWSLGVVFWESLAAERLFKGGNPAMTLRQIASMEIPRPSALRKDVPKAIDEICLGLLQRDRDMRIRTGRDLAEVLADVAGFPPGAAKIGDFVKQRFVSEAQQGIAESQRASRSLAILPMPMGLVDGGAEDAVDEEGPRTEVVDPVELAKLLHEVERARAHPADDLPRTAVVPPIVHSTTTGEVVDLTVPSSEVTLEDRTESIPAPDFGGIAPTANSEQPDIVTVINVSFQGGELVAPAISDRTTPQQSRQVTSPAMPNKVRPEQEKPPAAPPPMTSSESLETQRKSRRRGPSAFVFGFTTFGVLSLVLGLIFSLLTAHRGAPSEVFLYYDGQERAVLVAHQEDVPPAFFNNRFKVPLAESRELPLRKSGPWVKPDTAKFTSLLMNTGIWTEAQLPRSRRDHLEVALPASVVLIGLLALAFAVPSFLFRRGLLWGARVLLTLTVIGGGIFLAQYGGFGWPGSMNLASDTPSRVILEEHLQP